MTLRIETAKAGAYGNATAADLEAAVGRLDEHNRYIAVRRENAPEPFAQAFFDLDGSRRYAVEYLHKSGELRRAFVADAESAYELLAGWAFDHAGWQATVAWESVANDQVVDLKSHLQWTEDGGELTVRFAPLGLEATAPDRESAMASLLLALEDATQDRQTALAFSAWCGDHLVRRAELNRREWE